MRVISGTAKGHKLRAPDDLRVRPALDKVKAAIFNILFDVSGLRVIDLYAGSGAVGIEALSRGATSAVFVEEWHKAADFIRANLAHTKLADRATIIESSVKKAITLLSKRGEEFDLLFVDPPYEKDLVKITLEDIAMSGIAREGALIVVEHHPKEPIGDVDGLALTDSRKYGQTCVSFLRQK